MAVACIAHQALAQQTEAVQTTLVAEVRDDREISPGRSVPRLVPATALTQGQEVFYTVRILNSTPDIMRAVVVVQRIPQNTTYVPKSAAGPGAAISFSADGGQTFAAEDELVVTEPGRAGRPGLTRPATPQDFTHIRWQLRNSLAGGAVALARFRSVFR